jgi:DNA-binding beta-propeller fold protein YncE
MLIGKKDDGPGTKPEIFALCAAFIELVKYCRRVMKMIYLAVLILVANSDMLYGQVITMVRYFDTWESGIIKSTDPSGITYHPHSGHLYIADSEINELPVFTGDNIFEVSLRGDVVFREFASDNVESAGITYDEFDQFFYVVNDDENTITRYDSNLDNALAVVVTTDDVLTAKDPEGITSDPATGLLYVANGKDQDGSSQVLVYDSNLVFQNSFFVVETQNPEGIALSPDNNHLFIVDGTVNKIFEYTVDGLSLNEYDLSGFSPTPTAAQGLTFGPTSDQNDDPNNLALYVADGLLDNDRYPSERDGRIYETIIIPSYEQVVPDGFKLKNYPNPFNGSTVIVYDVLIDTDVRITVTDILGREVAVLVNGRQSPGQHQVRFRSGGLPRGLYFAFMRAGGFTKAQKMILMN